MNKDVRDITHKNVERLLDAIKDERKQRAILQERVSDLEATVNRLLVEINNTKSKANAAFAMSKGRGSTTE